MIEMVLLLVLGCLWAALAMAFTLLRLTRVGDAGPLPPSPPSLPILGHLHLLQPPLHHSLHKLSQKLGPIFFIWMGSSPAVITSSPFWAKEFWHERDRDFVDRPFFEASKRIFYNCRTLVMMEYGSRWREPRKLYIIHMLSSKRVERSQKPRLDEMALCVRRLERQAASGGVVVDLRKLIFNTVGNMMTMMLFSKRSFDASQSANVEVTHFQELVDEALRLFGNPYLGDLVPWLKWLDVQGFRKRMDMVAKGLDVFLEEVLTERMSAGQGVPENDANKDYLDLLDVCNDGGALDRDSIKCILLDMLAASIETTTTSIEWIMAELLNNPSCMKKLHAELDTLVLTESATLTDLANCVIGDSQIIKLDYLQAVVKEALRLHPPFALIFRQMNKELDKGTQIGGFHLPKKTRVFLNLWAMARDTSVWGPEAANFHPERFLTANECRDPRGRCFDFLPFGTGRRGCPGMSMALTLVPFMVANLVLAFDWKIPNAVQLDLSEGATLTAPPLNPITAIPVPRQPNSCLLKLG